MPRPDPDRDHDEGGGALRRLLANRVVVITGRLTDRRTTRAAAELMTLNAEGDGPVTLYLNCPEGELDAAFTLADTVELMTVEVTADCRGRLGGPPLVVFAVADRRVCSAHATFRLGEPQASLSGRAQEIDAQADALRAQVDRLVACIAEACGRSPDQVANDMRSGRILDAEQAMAYGLVHQIAQRTPHATDADRSQP
ncbi:MAG: ATP-dependent Clp protease proteolytic subunit [Actinobacteria bacterium]|nr:ATP-dependent Clp protease proteolytic subunit [Actinomycetota bacterium]